MKEIFKIVSGVFNSSSSKLVGRVTSKKRTVNCYEIELFDKDYYYCNINGKKIPFKANTIIIAKPNDVRNSKLHFSCRFIHLYCKKGEISDFFDSCPSQMKIFDFSAYAKEFDLIAKLSNGEENYFDLLSAMYKLMSMLDRDKTLNKKSLFKKDTLSNPFVVASKYIEENFTENITLQDIANVAGFNPSYFHRAYKKQFGISPVQKLIHVRLTHAKYLLASTTDTVSDIAQKAGFASQTYFSYSFKNQFGITPKEYRKNLISPPENTIFYK